MANEDREAVEKLSDARTQLLMKFPFFGYLALNLNYEEDKLSGGQGTACVTPDGTLYYNPEFINDLDLMDCMIVLCHELLHLVQGATQRFPEGGDHETWNIAADWVVNGIICETPKLRDNTPFFKKVYPDDVRSYAKGKTTEQIYIDLMKDKAPNPEGECCGGNVEGEKQGECPEGQAKDDRNKMGCPSGAMAKEMNARQEREWQQRVIYAAQAEVDRNSGHGDLPGFLQDFLAKLNKPTITWRDHIRRSASAVFKGRYTWARPARRSTAIGARLQARKPTPKGAVVVVDTSGSISDKMIIQFLSEIAGIIRTCGAPWVHVYFHDVECYHDEKFNIKTINKIRVQRGGTSHIPVFEKIVKDKEDVGMIVCFTDLETSFPAKPKCPVLWATPTRYMGHDVPWGTKIEVKMDGFDDTGW
jgi:predicted metal-dependent peptidase